MRSFLYTVILCLTSLFVNAQCNAVVTTVGNTTFCQGGSVKLIGSSGNHYQWMDNGIPIGGANDDTLVVTAGGNYTVVIDSAGCIDTSAILIVVESPQLPAPGAIVGPDTICNGIIQTYSTAAVQGAAGYVWYGIYNTTDTTALPTITGNVLPGQSSPLTNISVRAFDGCIGQSSTKQVVNMGIPQWGGSWNMYDIDVADLGLRVCPGTAYTLHPIIHGYAGIAYTDPYTLQWYENNIAIPGATGWNFVVTRGGNYSVKASTYYCAATHTFQKKVYQDVPNSITISPAGPLSFCVGNATPLTVSFDMTGVSDPIKWNWITGSHYVAGGSNAYSILPDTSGYYTVWAPSTNLVSCPIYATNAVSVITPPQLAVTQIDSTLYATPGYSSYQWFESNVAIAGATAQSYLLTYDGLYSVEATFVNGCVETTGLFDSNYKLPPEEEEEEEKAGVKDISVQPNPTKAVFTLFAKIPVEDKTAEISITDMMGRPVFLKTVEAKDGVVEQEIYLKCDIERHCILKLRSNGSNKTISILQQ